MRIYLQIYMAVFLLRAGLFGVLPFSLFQTKRPPAGKEQEKPERMW